MLNYCEFIICFPVEPILIGLENFNSTNIVSIFFILTLDWGIDKNAVFP
jgi:hypothetical protein